MNDTGKQKERCRDTRHRLLVGRLRFCFLRFFAELIDHWFCKRLLSHFFKQIRKFLTSWVINHASISDLPILIAHFVKLP